VGYELPPLSKLEMPKRITTYKLKLKPTVDQSAKLDQWLGVCRLIYNLGLDTRIQAYQKKKVSVSKSELQLQVKELANEYPWVKDIQAQVRQDPLVRLERSYKNFFRGEGFPKFAKKGEYRSFTFPQGVVLRGNKLFLPKFGELSFFSGKRDLSTFVIKQGKIIKEPTGWFISLMGEVDVYHLEKNDRKIGIDIGIANYIVTSDGEFVANPQIKKSFAKRIRIKQRSIARKKKGSSRRKKEVIALKKLYFKERNSRNDFQQKLSTRLINENQVIVAEELMFSNMTKSARGTTEEPGGMVKQKSGLNRSLMDVAGYSFFGMLSYKADWYGRTFVKVNPKNTSIECPCCGHTEKGNRRTQAVFLCLNCGYTKHADYVAANNILGRTFPSGDTSGVIRGPEKLHL
jgi:putative transposase